ncbi:MAG: SGNH/GDSL hydrolase family protein [Pseudomonadota bacterium]
MSSTLHIVLLGDSIFDNGAYVPGEPPVREQLEQILPEGASVTLLAVDGDTTVHVEGQLEDMPSTATHVVLSCGGNDALNFLPEFTKTAGTIADAMFRFGEIRQVFRSRYHDMLRAIMAHGLPLYVCTIYDQVPNIGEAERAALAMFNEIILQEAQSSAAAIIDLRLICREAGDYSSVSPIEPSVQGGQKIASAIRSAILDDHLHARVPIIGGPA